MSSENIVSLLAEIPESLYNGVQGYLSDHPDWDCDRVMKSAIALFLLQNGATDSDYRQYSRAYLNGLLGE